jgi:hypothetical protein
MACRALQGFQASRKAPQHSTRPLETVPRIIYYGAHVPLRKKQRSRGIIIVFSKQFSIKKLCSFHRQVDLSQAVLALAYVLALKRGTLTSSSPHNSGNLRPQHFSPSQAFFSEHNLSASFSPTFQPTFLPFPRFRASACGARVTSTYWTVAMYALWPNKD